jgi:hypothetical protein
MLNSFKKELRPEEIYSFNIWLGLYLSYTFYIIYSLVPKQYFDQIGLSFLPHKYWCIAIPTHFSVLILCIFIFTLGLNMYISEPLVKKGIFALKQIDSTNR